MTDKQSEAKRLINLLDQYNWSNCNDEAFARLITEVHCFIQDLLEQNNKDKK